MRSSSCCAVHDRFGRCFRRAGPAPHYALGFDFARVADLSVLSLLAIEKNLKRREVLSIEMRNVPGDEQKAIVAEVMGCVRERLLGAAFDATGMGWTVAEDMAANLVCAKPKTAAGWSGQSSSARNGIAYICRPLKPRLKTI